jgi:hypothetical protein
MPYAVDFHTVSTVGLESSPVVDALAGLRAHEARYFKNKYDHVFTVEAAGDAKTTIAWVHRILEQERDIVIASRPLEATAFQRGWKSPRSSPRSSSSRGRSRSWPEPSVVPTLSSRTIIDPNRSRWIGGTAPQRRSLSTTPRAGAPVSR